MPDTESVSTVQDGFALLALEITADGRIGDTVTIAASGVDAAAAARRSVQTATFRPGRRDGMPVVSHLAAFCRFENGRRHLATSSLEEAIMRTNDHVVRLFQLGDLDRTPSLLTDESPRHLADTGQLVLEFLIDVQGGVRMPAVLTGDAPVPDHAILDVVRRWRFSVPCRAGEPVPVLVRQQIRFDRR